MDAQIRKQIEAEKKALVNVDKVPVDVQINYVSGGGAVNLPVRVSALVRAKGLSFADFSEFSFSPPQVGQQARSDDGEEENTASADALRVIYADEVGHVAAGLRWLSHAAKAHGLEPLVQTDGAKIAIGWADDL